MPSVVVLQGEELKEATTGGFVELISEFEIKPGATLDPHSHHTLEFYYVTSGRGIMTISGEERQAGPRDLITIPPDAVHSIRPPGACANSLPCGWNRTQGLMSA
jgi:quercetin dioxygenase-like cupin family protein